MGKAGKALRQVLETYNISQNRLAVTMGVARSNIYHWVNENKDPVAEAVLGIRKALSQINPQASADFIRLYLEDVEEKPEE